MIAIRLAGVKYLPDIVNGCLLVFTTSFANSDIYIAARSIYGLAKDNQAPAIFKRTTNGGVPVYAVALASLFCLLALLNVSTSSATVFGYFVSVSTVLGLINWLNILMSYFSFLRGLNSQGLSRKDLPWRGPLQPYGACYSVVITVIVIIFNGWSAFVPHFKGPQFITSYIGIVVYLGNIFTWKTLKRTKRVKAGDMDLVTGRQFLVDTASVESEKKCGMWKRSSQRIKGVLWGN